MTSFCGVPARLFASAPRGGRVSDGVAFAAQRAVAAQTVFVSAADTRSLLGVVPIRDRLRAKSAWVIRPFATASAATAAARARRHGRPLPKKSIRVGAEAAAHVETMQLQLEQFQGTLASFEEEIRKPDDQISLIQAASLLALHADPTMDAHQQVVTPLAALGAAFKERIASDTFVADTSLPEATRLYCVAAALCAFMAEKGFRGCARSADEYYLAENSLMHKVIELRRGIPISLALVYMEVGCAAGFELQGVNFPGHFLLGFGNGPSVGLVDAYTNGVLPQEHALAHNEALGGSLPRLSKHIFLMRMVRNLHFAYERDKNFEQVARVLQYAQCLEKVAVEAQSE